MRLVTPTRLLACPDFNMINCQRLLVLVLRASDYSTQLLAISMLLATSMPLASARVSGGPGLKFFPEPPEELCRAQPTAGGGPGAPPRGSLRRSCRRNGSGIDGRRRLTAGALPSRSSLPKAREVKNGFVFSGPTSRTNRQRRPCPCHPTLASGPLGRRECAAAELGLGCNLRFLVRP